MVGVKDYAILVVVELVWQIVIAELIKFFL